MKQKTLTNTYTFWGKGLHTGKYSNMKVCPAPAGTGIRFHRVDMGPDAFVDALAENVSSTRRSTTISNGKVKVSTVEHIISALTGLDVDNAIIEIDNAEVPILDGSAGPYMDAMTSDPLVEQDAERVWVELKETIEYRNPRSDSYVRIEPADDYSIDLTIDFNSHVLGVQTVHWDRSMDYSKEIGPCRTFCFLHEVEMLAMLGLVKGGDVKNAIVVVEKPTTPRKVARLAKLFRQPALQVTPEGYLSNLVLRFPDECGRHKLLDIMGDLRLAGGFLKAKITAYKPGHKINTGAAKTIKEKIN